MRRLTLALMGEGVSMRQLKLALVGEGVAFRCGVFNLNGEPKRFGVVGMGMPI